MSGDGCTKHVAIVGGGLVGALDACFMAKRGFKVDLYEKREDIRLAEAVNGRSINLALSNRGRAALREVGLEDAVTKKAIPMRARMIHNKDGSTNPQPYGKQDQYIMAVDRSKLNGILLTAAEKYSNVTTHFQYKLLSCNFKTGSMVLENKDGKVINHTADLIIGADGAFSTVRKQMMKDSLMNYQQEYIPHGYMELIIAQDKSGNYALPKNFLHLWPRNDFMMLASPNIEKSFTATLHMPFELFNSIKTEEDVVAFFEAFQDAVPLIGIEVLKETYLKNKALPMVNIKCSPHHAGNKGILLGDAAHAMVPFFGQGMNTGFEDCLVLNEILDEHNDNFDTALPAYSEYRIVDTHAICDLAMYNYEEMKKLVNSKMFFLRKKIDNTLHALFPNFWVPLYTMVSFTRMRYHECAQRKEWQDKMVTRSIQLGGLVVSISACFFLWQTLQSKHNGLNMYSNIEKILVGLKSFVNDIVALVVSPQQNALH